MLDEHFEVKLAHGCRLAPLREAHDDIDVVMMIYQVCHYADDAGIDTKDREIPVVREVSEMKPTRGTEEVKDLVCRSKNEGSGSGS